MRREDFGDEFVWGVACAAFQVEGAAEADGKPPSVWDDLGRRGRIRGGPVGDQAIDFYHRYPEDLDLIASLGFGAFRFSISWPRLLGTGRGPVNTAGADFYDRVIDGCLERGLEPWVTAHHWDLPLALHEEGGWSRRGIVDDFATLAETCAERFGDRVRRWMVFNEPMSVYGFSLTGMDGRRGFYPRKALRCAHHMNLACAEAGRRMRSVLGDEADIGITHVTNVGHPYDPTDERTRRRKAMLEALTCDLFIDPAGGLGYPTDRSRLLRLIEPAIEDGDLEAVQFTYDFLGIQYYGPIPLRRLPVIGAIPVPHVRGAEVAMRSAVGLPVDADGLLWTLRKYHGHPAARRLVVTENGLGAQDRLRDGRVRDDVRTWYLRNHLQAVLDARSEGIDVDGYFCWSYSDNIEWFLGRDPRFGLVYIDYDDDFRRVPKDSALWFRDFLAGQEA